MSYSTTVYEPAEGAHEYVRGNPDEANSDCATCGDAPWRDSHAMVERHVHDIPAEDCLYRMDASDNNGKSWGTNGLRWRTQEDAARWTRDLSLRWFGCTNLRIVREVDDEIMEVIL